MDNCYESHFPISLNYVVFTETRKEGRFISGELFASETNNVDVKFTSDDSVRRTGFSLNITSTLCYSVQEVVVAAAEVLEGAIVSYTQSDGLYPNRALQDWIITTEENQVHIMFQSKQPLTCCFLV